MILTLMNRIKKHLLLFLVLILPSISFAKSGVWYVSNPSDDVEQGTLRVVLQEACDTKGDETIQFEKTRLSQINIVLKKPLVIPEDCKGTVTIEGSSEVDTLLDGKKIMDGGVIVGDSCILNVYADGNTIKNFSFVNNKRGAGICLFGRDNIVENNRFGLDLEGNIKSNLYGIVVSNVFVRDYPHMDGSANLLLQNKIYFNDSHGIWIRGEDIVVYGNEIFANGGCPDEDLYPSHDFGCSESNEDLGYGIFVGYASSNVKIEKNNIIKYNRDGGIAVKADVARGIWISSNVISNNYGSGLGIDLNIDGITENDPLDEDEGSNDLLNYIDYAQAFPMPPTDDDWDRFWLWGVTSDGERVEIYRVSAEDTNRGIDHGGAESLFWTIHVVTGMTFDLGDDIFNYFSSGDVLTFLTFDDMGNTSEFSYNIPVGLDEDMDGIIDQCEGSNSSLGSLTDNPDTDGDGLADVVEDKNRNGKWEPELGETSAYLADSDDDQINDYYEIHGDNFYDPHFDTDPLNYDSDGDLVMDGLEDKNGNGIWEVYLGETNPLSKDTDDDGYNDSLDTCPIIYNPGQEDYYCQL